MFYFANNSSPDYKKKEKTTHHDFEWKKKLFCVINVVILTPVCIQSTQKVTKLYKKDSSFFLDFFIPNKRESGECGTFHMQ